MLLCQHCISVLQVTRMLQEQGHKSCIRSAYGRQSNSFHSSYFFQTIKILLQNLLQNTPTKYYGFFQNLKKKIHRSLLQNFRSKYILLNFFQKFSKINWSLLQNFRGKFISLTLERVLHILLVYTRNSNTWKISIFFDVILSSK